MGPFPFMALAFSVLSTFFGVLLLAKDAVTPDSKTYDKLPKVMVGIIATFVIMFQLGISVAVGTWIVQNFPQGISNEVAGAK